ncbi:MAG: ester cyclase [bacterium]|nr:ester cyclase [bacterium]
MKGFDPKFSDPPDYILGITKEIWEDRGVDALHRYYAPKVIVRSPDGVVVGNEEVISATLATLAEFPDRQLLGEDVIWSKDEDGGFLSSHRIFSTATHLGDGAYGPASGTRLRYRIIADCACRENQVYDEWLIRDQGAIVRQLGIDPKRFASDQIANEGGFEGANPPLAPADDVEAIYRGSGNDHEVGVVYAEALEQIMQGRLAVVPEAFDRAVHLELPGGEVGHGWGDADAFWLGLRSALPDASFRIHHQIGRSDTGMAPRAALRWSLDGTHDGWGAFGAPSGAPIHVMGLSHAEFGPWGLRREYVLYDETAIWKQILLHTG